MNSLDAQAGSSTQRKLRILCFGAHPDDCELHAGGTAAMWAAQGHQVKMVCTTNGDIGHWRECGEPLAKRRRMEVEAAAKVLGVTVEVLDIHDGELMPTLENRRLFTKLIREWHADIVISHRPNDYHPDHRYTGVLVQDSAFMVTVPFFCPEIPVLKENPVFLFSSDGFQKPTPFSADIIVDIDPVLDQKLIALDLLVSQFYEGGALGGPECVPDEPVAQARRRAQVRKELLERSSDLANRFRSRISEWYPAAHAARVRHIEPFEICEYGRQPDKAEIKRLFPFYS